VVSATDPRGRKSQFSRPEIFKILDKIIQYQTNWFHHLEIMDEGGFSKRIYTIQQKVGEDIRVDHAKDGRIISDFNLKQELASKMDCAPCS
jgi:hypothetical protein